MTLDVYAHVFDEFDIAERVSAEDQIAQARRDVSVLCPPGSDETEEEQETPASPNTNNLGCLRDADPDRLPGLAPRLRPVSVVGALDAEARHLAL
ncbi:MAG: hypothetical protein AB7F97_07490, partial [Solirubrobacterales bacterium]